MPHKLLLVDDSSTVRMVERMTFANSPYDLSEANTGEAALQIIRESPPDLVLLDIKMPGIDGIQCCRAIKTDPATQHLPVIMVTTRSEQARIDEAFAAGCDDFVTKPIDAMELAAKVKRLLEEATKSV